MLQTDEMIGKGHFLSVPEWTDQASGSNVLVDQMLAWDNVQLTQAHGDAADPLNSDASCGDKAVVTSSETARTQANGSPACVHRAATRAGSGNARARVT